MNDDELEFNIFQILYVEALDEVCSDGDRPCKLRANEIKQSINVVMQHSSFSIILKHEEESAYYHHYHHQQ